MLVFSGGHTFITGNLALEIGKVSMEKSIVFFLQVSKDFTMEKPANTNPLRIITSRYLFVIRYGGKTKSTNLSWVRVGLGWVVLEFDNFN